MKKRKEEAIEEAKLALQEYEQLEGTVGAVNLKPATASGRRVFGMANNEASESNNKIKTDNKKMKMDNYYGNSDSEDDLEAKENLNITGGRKNDVEKDAGPNCVHKEAADVRQDSVFKVMWLLILLWASIFISFTLEGDRYYFFCGTQNFDDIVRDPGPKTTYEVAIFTSDSWRKVILCYHFL